MLLWLGGGTGAIWKWEVYCVNRLQFSFSCSVCRPTTGNLDIRPRFVRFHGPIPVLLSLSLPSYMITGNVLPPTNIKNTARKTCRIKSIDIIHGLHLTNIIAPSPNAINCNCIRNDGVLSFFSRRLFCPIHRAVLSLPVLVVPAANAGGKPSKQMHWKDSPWICICWMPQMLLAEYFCNLF